MASREIGSHEAARILGVSVNTILRYAKHGIIKHRRLPSGVYRFDRADVESLRKQGEN